MEFNFALSKVKLLGPERGAGVRGGGGFTDRLLDCLLEGVVGGAVREWLEEAEESDCRCRAEELEMPSTTRI